MAKKLVECSNATRLCVHLAFTPVGRFNYEGGRVGP